MHNEAPTVQHARHESTGATVSSGPASDLSPER
jgi:hypothetical protein